MPTEEHAGQGPGVSERHTRPVLPPRGPSGPARGSGAAGRRQLAAPRCGLERAACPAGPGPARPATRWERGRAGAAAAAGTSASRRSLLHLVAGLQITGDGAAPPLPTERRDRGAAQLPPLASPAANQVTGRGRVRGDGPTERGFARGAVRGRSDGPTDSRVRGSRTETTRSHLEFY